MLRWLQKGGTGFPPINTRIAGLVARTARLINRLPIVRTLAGMTRLKTLLQLDSFHATFLKMNASGTIFIAALNGSALAVGAELALACDLRIMADGDFVIGLTEVLLALTPGGGGSQRLPRLIGTQQTLVAVLEGRPFTPAEALSLGAVDEVVPQERGTRAFDRARRIPEPTIKEVSRSNQAIHILWQLSVARTAACSLSTPSSWSGINQRKLSGGCLNILPPRTPLASSPCWIGRRTHGHSAPVVSEVVQASRLSPFGGASRNASMVRAGGLARGRRRQSSAPASGTAAARRRLGRGPADQPQVLGADPGPQVCWSSLFGRPGPPAAPARSSRPAGCRLGRASSAGASG